MKMKKLNLDLFVSAVDDVELSQYYLLGILKKFRIDLRSNKLYPALSELIEIGNLLSKIVNEKSNLERIFPQKSTDSSLQEKTEVVEDEHFASDINKVFDFINWAYPKVNEAITEGKAIYSFVKENMLIEEVGILPLYKNNGYFIIADNKDSSVQVYRYDIPFISTDMNSSASMQTSLVKTYERVNLNNNSGSHIKLDLIEKYNDLPNPATYNFEIDLDFPFAETILPVAKRRLLKKLAA